MKKPRRPPHLFWLAVRNILCAKLESIGFPAGDDADGVPHAYLKLDLHKPMPSSDFHRCLITLVAMSRGDGEETRITCTVEMVVEGSPRDGRRIELMLVPVKRNEDLAPKKGMAVTSNESAFQSLAMQSAMYVSTDEAGNTVGHFHQLIERIEFAAEEDPLAAETVPHGIPIPAGDGGYPELTYVQGDLGGDDADIPASEPESEPELEFDLVDEPKPVDEPKTSPPRRARTTAADIFEGVLDFDDTVFNREPKRVAGQGGR